MSRRSTQALVPTLLINGALLVLALASIGPLLWMVSVSFMPSGQANTFPPPLLPRGANLDSYRQLFDYAGMGRRFFNSALLAVLA